MTNDFFQDLAERFESAAMLGQVLHEGEQSRWWASREPEQRARAASLPRIQVRRETELHGRDSELQALQELFGVSRATIYTWRRKYGQAGGR